MITPLYNQALEGAVLQLKVAPVSTFLAAASSLPRFLCRGSQVASGLRNIFLEVITMILIVLLCRQYFPSFMSCVLLIKVYQGASKPLLMILKHYSAFTITKSLSVSTKNLAMPSSNQPSIFSITLYDIETNPGRGHLR